MIPFFVLSTLSCTVRAGPNSYRVSDSTRSFRGGIFQFGCHFLTRARVFFFFEKKSGLDPDQDYPHSLSRPFRVVPCALHGINTNTPGSFALFFPSELSKNCATETLVESHASTDSVRIGCIPRRLPSSTVPLDGRPHQHPLAAINARNHGDSQEGRRRVSYGQRDR